MHSSSSKGQLLWMAIALLILLTLVLPNRISAMQQTPVATSQLLTDPFLQLPTATSVRVVWFTAFAGARHWVEYGEGFEQEAIATTTQLSRVAEDPRSRVGLQTEDGQVYQKRTAREVWRHEAEVTGLPPNSRLPYRVISAQEDGGETPSGPFTLAPAPEVGKPLKILLTSDHQLMPMTSANLQKVVETVGQVDAVFLAGDLTNVPDRASEWFDDNRGGAFFPCLQGRADYQLERRGTKTRYAGGALIQYAPLFPAIGNHEVMGRFSTETTLAEQFNDAFPRKAAAAQYAQTSNSAASDHSTSRDAWVKNNSFNTDTYEEIFSLPKESPGGKQYYAVTFGDIRLVVLYATNIWRSPNLSAETKGRYRERDEDLAHPERWGYGQHIFEPIHASETDLVEIPNSSQSMPLQSSLQYTWLQNELNSPTFQQAKYKIVMFHHPPHSLGDNIVPPYTDPVQSIDRDSEGQIKAVRYEYPIEADYLIRDVVPLLESAGVQLVFYGHSHLWNRFISPNGTHFLESSNVGNTYGAYVGDKRRPVPTGYAEPYTATGNPNELEPVMPAIAPLLDEAGQPQPYIASNLITAFSILDTETGLVSSYRFDTRTPELEVVKFDELQLLR